MKFAELSEKLKYTTYAFTVVAAAEVTWKGGYDEYFRGFACTYDPANRLLASNYGFLTANQYGPTWILTKRYKESDISYDRNGNNTEFTRYHGNHNKIDQLAYRSYNGNQLGLVNDYIEATIPIGFQDKTDGSGYDYSYDANGNLTRDYKLVIDRYYKWYNKKEGTGH